MKTKEYYSIHGWLRRNCIKKRTCENCGTTEAKKYDWALKKGCVYEKDINNFLELCRSCHLRYDYTEARRGNLSLAAKRSYRNNPERSKNQGRYKRKAIEQRSTDGVLIRSFISAREAERVTKVNISSIVKCCNNKQYKTAGGYVWKYKAIKEAFKLL